MKRLAIFKGHCGKDSGAIDGAGGSGDNRHTIEVEIISGIVSKIATLLDWLGMDHIVCSGDWSTRLAMSAGCDSGISIHADTCIDSRVTGPHVLYWPKSDNGRMLATYLDLAIDSYTPHSRRPHGERMYILQHTPFECVIVECGFLSNVSDEAVLAQESHQRNLAYQIVAGWRGYVYR